MNKEQALQVIEQALNGANLKGVFNLQDSATIQIALNTVKNILEKYIDETGKPFEVEVKQVKTK